ncbi:MAG: Wzz/FepE/Etk N-terminal domain-containing protein [Candidatus Gastranaerophilales bacterium]|nr:Wzz/FepE/Etk N-terminal domain-containing protein [Candidatus Gastranaerophilales bacterium]
MENQFNNNQNSDEIIIDFNKIWRIICYRKSLIITCFVLAIILSGLLTILMPKKYETEAKLLINKSSSTNLADINPFIISDAVDIGGGGMSSLLGGSSNLSNEIEILKSPLVLDPVIKINNLKYKKGKKTGCPLPGLFGILQT